MVSPPSHCPKCNHKLAWYDNVPIFGWLALGGKCRYCKNPISPRYPIVELVTALVFVMAYVLLFELHLAPRAAKATGRLAAHVAQVRPTPRAPLVCTAADAMKRGKAPAAYSSTAVNACFPQARREGS